MNSLSWFLYFAYVIPTLAHFLMVLTFFGIIFGPTIFAYFYFEERKTIHSLWVVPLVVGFISVFVPSQNTMYAIAASELGEEALKSNLGQKSLKALENWIDSQIEGKK